MDYMNKFIGKEVKVLIEEEKCGYSYGHTDNFLYCKIKGKFNHNSYVNTTIDRVEYPYCIGKWNI